jgi:uncharacterized membrane protein YidH (DUF202 family)
MEDCSAEFVRRWRSANGDGLSKPQPNKKERIPLPAGYRQGVITAITVLLGFSLIFLRYWGFELPGTWTISAAIAALLAGFSVVLQMIALWRSLQVEDDDEVEYKKTLRWFLISAILLLAAFFISYVSYLRVVHW